MATEIYGKEAKMMNKTFEGRVMVREKMDLKPDAFDVIDAFVNDEKIPGWKEASLEETLKVLSRPIEDSFMLAGLAEMRSKDAAREAYVNQMAELIENNERNIERELDYEER